MDKERFKCLAEVWYKVADARDIYRSARNESLGLKDSKTENMMLDVMEKLDKQIDKYRKK